MTEMLSGCPVCEKPSFIPFLDLKDYFLTQEEFSILKCTSCGLKFVNPRPDKTEIGRYYQSEEYISHDAAKRDILSTIYKFARIISIRKKFGVISKHCNGIKILDIGCGTGEFLKYCRNRKYQVKGMEPNEKARSFAQTKNSIPVVGELSELTGEEGTFNCITMWHVLEHIHDLRGLINRVKRLLAPGGVFIAAVPNADSWDASYYKEFWAAYDVPRHLYHFTKDTIQALATKNNLTVLKIYPQKLDAYYVSVLSEKYKSGKNNYIKSFLKGYQSNQHASDPDTGHSSLIFVISAKNS